MPLGKNLLYLVEVDFHRSGTSENLDRKLQPAFLLVNFIDDTIEGIEGTCCNAYFFSKGELHDRSELLLFRHTTCAAHYSLVLLRGQCLWSLHAAAISAKEAGDAIDTYHL